MRAGGLVRSLDGRAGTAEKAVGGDLGEPALGEVGEAGVGSRGDGAAHAREGVDADPGGVLALRRCSVPAAAPEGEQHRGVGDTAPVVGDDDDVFSVLEGVHGDGDPRGIAASRVLQQLHEGVGQRGIEKSRDLVDGRRGDVCGDRIGEGGGERHGGGCPDIGWENAPRDNCAAGRGRCGGVRCGAGIPGSRRRLPECRGRWRGQRQMRRRCRCGRVAERGRGRGRR